MAQPTEKTYNDLEGQKIVRIEAISDGVFAVALTLLVLDLHVPFSAAIHTENNLILSFCKITPKLLTYFLSFMTLGIFWTGHTTQFSFIEKSDRNLNWISLFFLMLVALLPFSTAFLSEYLQFRTALFAYWFNILLLGLMLLLHWSYAYNHDLLNIPADDRKQINKAVRKRIIIAQSLYAAGASLCFISDYLSIAVIIVIQLNYALPILNKRI